MITKNKHIFSFLTLLTVSFMTISCGDDVESDKKTTTPSGDSQVISEIVSGNENLSTLLAALNAAELVDVLSNENDQFTVFAPTDAAFAKLPEETLNDLLKPENKQKLTNILLFHVIAGNYIASEVLASDSLTTVFGQETSINSEEAKINGVSIIETDIMAKNGTIHLIDEVLLPKTILELAESAGFTTLVAAIEAAGLTDTLNGEGPFTVFAPTDEAFGKLPAGTIDSLLLPENKDDLTNILTYHVVAESLKAADVLASSSIATVQGQSVSVSADGAKINESSITGTDIIGSNGIIHIIDTVLIPE